MNASLRCSLSLLSLLLATAGNLLADEVLEWNRTLYAAAGAAAPPTNPLVVTRHGALVQVAVFDAVNGIDRKYTPLHVTETAPRGASKRAAAVQAAYAILVRLYPAQLSMLDAQRAVSMAEIAEDWPDKVGASVALGLQWGQEVADAIWAWRSGDGFTPPPPPYFGSTDVGVWRATPPANAPGAGVQFATMTPWFIPSPSEFRPGGPPSLPSEQYAADFEETRTFGSATSAVRTADQAAAAQFWHVGTANEPWSELARRMAALEDRPLVENARLFALLSVSLADSAIACWEAKYHYVLWRPITAIRLGDTDGNEATPLDASWTPFLATPAHPEYPSGHSSVSSAAAAVLEAFFGDGPLEVRNLALPGASRSFASYEAAVEDVALARITAGIHFRSACEDGMTLGRTVAHYVLDNAALRLHGQGGSF